MLNVFMWITGLENKKVFQSSREAWNDVPVKNELKRYERKWPSRRGSLGSNKGVNFSCFTLYLKRNTFPEQILYLKSNFWIQCRHTAIAFIAFLGKCKRLIFSRSLKFCGFVAVFLGCGFLLFSFCFDFGFIHKIKLKPWDAFCAYWGF